MANVFISYARQNEREAQQVAEALRAAGFAVWRDDELPPHRPYADVIEERLRAAKAVLTLWSADAVKSQWVRAEADVARQAGTLVQASLDSAPPPLPFNQIQCADLAGWTADAPGWRKVLASLAELVEGARPTADVAHAPAPRPPARPSKPSIALLPFANLSGDPEQDYFAEGMVEEITTALARFKSIFVVAAGALASNPRAVSPQEAARSLGVRYVLEGSVRKAGARVRIAVKLIDGDDGAQLWAERFEDTLDDLFDLQDRVALSVAGAIEPRVREQEIRRAGERPTDSAGAFDLYLRALPLYRAHTGPANAEAIGLLTRAIGLDPEFGAALALAASCHSRAAAFAWEADREAARTTAVALARRALRAAGDDPDVMVRAASVLSQDAKEDVAAVFQRAIALNPASSQTHLIIADWELRFGDPARAQAHLETSMRLDPLSPVRATQIGMLGTALVFQQRFEEALPAIAQAIQLNGRFPQAYAMLALCQAHLGRSEEARAAIRQMRELTELSLEDLAQQMFGRAELQRLLSGGLAKLEQLDG